MKKDDKKDKVHAVGKGLEIKGKLSAEIKDITYKVKLEEGKTYVIEMVSPDQQALTGLRYFLELPEAEVVVALNIPRGTVKSRLHRTLAKLREIIRRDYPDLIELTQHG